MTQVDHLLGYLLLSVTGEVVSSADQQPHSWPIIGKEHSCEDSVQTSLLRGRR